MSTADNPNTPPHPQRIISSVIIQNTPPQRAWEAITQPEFTSQYFFGHELKSPRTSRVTCTTFPQTGGKFGETARFWSLTRRGFSS